MLYLCYKCNTYGFFKQCNNCSDEQLNIPLNPSYYSEFEYKSKGIINDAMFKKKDQSLINSKLDSVLEKYEKFKKPYFVNYCFIANASGNSLAYHNDTLNKITLFENVLTNLGFTELQEYPDLLKKLIRSTEFNFQYEEFVISTRHHIKDTLEDTLKSWIEQKGDLFRIQLPLLIHYIYENNIFIESYLYNKDRYSYDSVPWYENYNKAFDFCEKLYMTISANRFQVTLEKFDPKNFITIYHIDAMNGYEFEDFLGEMFRTLGFEVKNTPKSNDQGADLFLELFGKKTVIQVKNYQSNVGNSAVQEVIAAKSFYSCDSAMVITNRYFTMSAKELAKSANVELVDRSKLQNYLTDYNRIMIENDYDHHINQNIYDNEKVNLITHKPQLISEAYLAWEAF